VTSVYDLQAIGRHRRSEDAGAVFRGVAAHDLHVIFNIPVNRRDISPCHWEATGIKNPQGSRCCSETNGPENAASWQLAGFFTRRMSAGHDGVWYREKARDFSQRRPAVESLFYYENAIYLLLRRSLWTAQISTDVQATRAA